MAEFLDWETRKNPANSASRLMDVGRVSMTSRNQYARPSLIVSPVLTSSVTPSPVGRVLAGNEGTVPCRGPNLFP